MRILDTVAYTLHQVLIRRIWLPIITCSWFQDLNVQRSWKLMRKNARRLGREISSLLSQIPHVLFYLDFRCFCDVLISWESGTDSLIETLLFGDHSYILTTFTFDKAVMFYGEITCWSSSVVKSLRTTVEPWFKEPLYNKVLGITNDFLQHGQNYSEMCGTETRCNKPRFNGNSRDNERNLETYIYTSI